jgi:Ca-activated chloride channel homolog
MEDRTQQVVSPPSDTERTVATGPMLPGSLPTVMGAPLRALDVEVLPGNRYAIASGGTRQQVLLLLKASNTGIGRRLPLNLCLVIDRSGSMEGDPLEYVKRACCYVVDLLEPSDVLSIVTFEESIDVVMPARRVVNKALIKEHINRIQPGNTTNLHDGLLAGCAQVASVTTPGYLQRVLLLTDGEPTSGIKDFTSIVGQVAEQKSRGISVTALGFGPEYNEELMAGIARRSGGNYYYIAQPNLIPEVFRRELEMLMTISAKNVRVRVAWPRGVSFRYAYGVGSVQTAARNADYQLPEIERGSRVASLVEFEYDRHVPGTYRVARFDVNYDDAVTGRSEHLPAEAVVEFVTDPVIVETGVNLVVQQELEVHIASRNLEKTMMGMRTQQLSTIGVMQELQRTRTILMQTGRTAQAQEVGQAMDMLSQGGEVEKTLIGTIYTLDQGKQQQP